MLAILFDSYLAGYVVGWNINYLVDYLLSYTVSVPLWDAQHSKRSCCCRWVLQGGRLGDHYLFFRASLHYKIIYR